MAGTNDFKAFATDANANVTSQEEWETLTALKKGFSSGKASSAQVSKALRQPSTMAAVLGQFIANAELDALDDGDVDGLVAKLATAITTNLDLGGASKCDVGTTEGTVAAGNDGRFGKMLGVGQSIQNVTASRAPGITYTNSTGRPIFVSVTCKGQPQPSLTELYISGVLACTFYKATASDGAVSGVVPDGAEYSIKISSGSISNWAELR